MIALILFVCLFCVKSYFGLEHIPIVDISTLHSLPLDDNFCDNAENVVSTVHTACTSSGFFYIKNHLVPDALLDKISELATKFFSLSLEEKKSISMHLGGKAWRGFFAVGEEVTSGIPDQKEGIYFGTELDSSDERPLHGPNLWMKNTLGDEMKIAVLDYMAEMNRLGKLLMRTISCRFSLTVDEKIDFLNQFENPTELFRIFNYPPHNISFPSNSLGVGEHTDYGYLTILRQDKSGGLQVKSLDDPNQWIDAPPVEGTFVINLGDALEHATDGLYRATPHRVLQRTNATENRLSMPYFFDPSFNSEMRKIAVLATDDNINRLNTAENIARRWDESDPRQFKGTYGSYLLNKVSRAFPDLFTAVVSEKVQVEARDDKEL